MKPIRTAIGAEDATFRKLLAVAGGIYLVWWFAVEALLPGSFNPFLSRLLVVLAIGIFLLLSFFSEFARNRFRYLFLAGVWLITIHYYYLFYRNSGDTNWVVGCFITVIAINFGMFSIASLLTYSALVVLLSGGLVLVLPSLAHTVFLPGILTIVLQANVGMSSRLKILKTLAESKARNEVMAEGLRARDEFISIASHELRTPLTSLALQTEFHRHEIASGEADAEYPPRFRTFITLADRQAKRLIHLVEAMLDVSRISNGEFRLARKVIDLSSLTREIADIPHPTYGTSPAEIRVQAPERVEILADPYRLDQVVENLIGNALKYGEEKPIDIRVYREDGHAVLEVTDYGPGIAEADFPKIFDRFERIPSSENIGGLGLGLYISRQIVEAHGGKITVKSAIGKGSTFQVRIPLNAV